jgi:hypothetical protein
MLSEAARREALQQTPETMREKLRQFRDSDPAAYRAMFQRLVPAHADALSDRQLEVNCDAMLKGLARLARRNRGLASLH